MDRKAAAEARRAKLLARGDDRLARITGTLQEPSPVAGAPPDIPHAALDAQQAPAMTPAVAPAEAAVAPPPPPAAAAAPPTPTTSGLAAELGAAVRSRSTGISPPQLQQPKGTATNSKWAQYAAPGAAARPKRQLRRVSAGETLSAAVLGTSRLRLLLAALLAVLLASRWDAAAVAKAGAGHGSQPAAPAAAAVPASARPWTELGARWQGLVQQARSAVSSLPSLGRVVKEHEEAQRQPQLLAGLARKVKAQVAAAAASPAGRQAAAAAQLLHSRLSEAAASPACRQAAAAVQALRAQAAAAAGSPAGQAAAAAAQAVRAKLVAAAASPAAQQAKAGLARLVGLPQLLHARLEALAAVPAVQAALDTAARLPPLAAVALLSLSLIGAAAAALAAAPSLVHSTLELDLHTPGLLMRLASAVPGLARRLSLLAAWQRLATGLLDDAAAFVVALVAYHQLPQLTAGAQAWLHS